MSNKKILIFDDDIATLEVVSIIFKDLGYQVEIAETADDIISKVSLFKPDLIMMDISIPVIGGIEATRLLKSQEIYNEIPVMIITANNDIEQLSARANADAYLSKPFDLNELEEKVANLLT
ncbi:response regulator [Chryseobacterium sp. KACC 21268]|nr:response regulator [Chryseobacterium sp. KACC 21268]